MRLHVRTAVRAALSSIFLAEAPAVPSPARTERLDHKVLLVIPATAAAAVLPAALAGLEASATMELGVAVMVATVALTVQPEQLSMAMPANLAVPIPTMSVFQALAVVEVAVAVQPPCLEVAEVIRRASF
jgi:hypothetical protein